MTLTMNFYAFWTILNETRVRRVEHFGKVAMENSDKTSLALNFNSLFFLGFLLPYHRHFQDSKKWNSLLGLTFVYNYTKGKQTANVRMHSKYYCELKLHKHHIVFPCACLFPWQIKRRKTSRNFSKKQDIVVLS